ncbi:hypothetical protein GNF10_14255 [Nostoc sp. UCD121]|uniref:hypothetical protein n=1 Tax=unclassified Nostoc TaxID=2593658 RepID=UPI0016294C77|nr:MULTISPECIES: hypothetical protein [unclassified Nostoc]MBC1218560.1 hypothetical protein [Nostoc sp. UCD120]MBC1277105.1 hypothetical protein [Nostoc sp. UCD121]MBC1298661.1 hypothetical protein [Nostoc sp. UCD122]
MTQQKFPPSEMIRVPTALIPVVRELSRLHRQGHTIALLKGLEELLSGFDSNIDIDVAPSSKSVLQLELKLETKLDAMTKKLELIERAISSNRYNSQPKQRRQAHPYQQPQVELLALPPENLAPRLGLSPSSLAPEREKLTTKEFISWTRNRDPRGIGWEWNAKDGLYHPVK